MNEPTTPYGLLLFTSQTRAQLADQAAAAIQRAAWYSNQLSYVSRDLDRLIELTRELDVTPTTQKQRDIIYDLRKIARHVNEALTEAHPSAPPPRGQRLSEPN